MPLARVSADDEADDEKNSASEAGIERLQATAHMHTAPEAAAAEETTEAALLVHAATLEGARGDEGHRHRAGAGDVLDERGDARAARRRRRRRGALRRCVAAARDGGRGARSDSARLRNNEGVGTVRQLARRRVLPPTDEPQG